MPTQQTLTGDTIDADDHDRYRPRTYVYCGTCDDWVLRSNRFDHDDTHDVFDPDQRERKWCTECNQWFDPIDALAHNPRHDRHLQDEPQQAGNWYTVELVYEARVVVTVPAMNTSDAKRRADSKWADDGIQPELTHQLHSDVTKRDEIRADDDVAVDEHLLP